MHRYDLLIQSESHGAALRMIRDRIGTEPTVSVSNPAAGAYFVRIASRKQLYIDRTPGLVRWVTVA